jgi:hypothetical protein
MDDFDTDLAHDYEWLFPDDTVGNEENLVPHRAATKIFLKRYSRHWHLALRCSTARTWRTPFTRRGSI